jgi:hypothetical protein
VDSTGKKPGFPLQVLGFADANPVGFPLQSHCARTSGGQAAWAAKQQLYIVYFF